MSLSGYDRRKRNVERVPYISAKNSTSSGYTGTIHLKSQEVVSWRDNCEGQPLLDITVDPYMGYLASTNDTKYKEQQRVQLVLERAGLPGLPDYEVKQFVDTGHVFDSKKDYVNTSLRSTRTYVSHPSYGAFEGGPFYAASATVSKSNSGLMPFRMNTGSYTDRTFMPNGSYKLPLPAESELESYGKKALSIVAPGRPRVDLFRAVGELLAGIPQLPGRALLTKQDFASGGDEWLNMLFGLMPTHSDAIEIGSVLKDISGALLQYRRDAGRVVRRKMEFPEIVRSEIFTNAQLDPNSGKIYAGSSNYGFNRTAFTGGLGDSSNNQVRRDLPTTSEIFMRETRTIKFAGAFTYYIPTSPEFAGRVGRYATELDRLIGLSPSLVNVWELTPWSWLSDWFIDIKSQLDLADVAFDDNLVINYGYAMEHTFRSVVCKTSLVSPTPLSGVSFASTYMTSERKRRIRANPYGFVSSVNSQGWNPFRWSILAALGLSRLR